jgi:glycosyltransferase involved in cell wall biosynthesis
MATVTAIHQLIPTLAPRDAVGVHTMAARGALRAAGFRSDIYALEAKGEFRRDARDYRRFPGARGAEPTWIMYQMSVGSPVSDFVVDRVEPLIVNYHNVTPRLFFRDWEPVVARRLARGRDQLRALAARAELGIAVSRFNEAELIDLGFARTAVAPVIVDPATFSTPPDRALLDRLHRTRRGARWLFVGRIAPNKAQHDVVRAFAVYREVHDRDARLTLVGGTSSHAYETALHELVVELGLDDAITLTGTVSAAALSAYYAAADVFVVCSEHEGFCVPLLEAMSHHVPIVAFADGGVAETLARAGVLVDTKDAWTIAAAVERVMRDDELRCALVGAGTARLDEFSPERTRRALVDAIRAVVR